MITRTGLNTFKGNTYAPVKHVLMLEPAHLTAFALATKISESAASGLTLRSYLDRYPPVTEALIRNSQVPRPRGVFPPWLMTSSIRCCPHCLAGDGSQIQLRHGGPWKRDWRLPVVFACLEHGVLLQDACPGCRQPLHSGFPNHPLRLLPAAAIADLHPAQCRNSAGRHKPDICGTRLDQPDDYPPQPELTATTRALQQRLLNLLDPAHQDPTAFATFANLRVMTAVLQAAWPHHAELPAPPHLREALDRHAADQKQQIEAGTRGRSQRTELSWSAPPASAAATAALLDMASFCLGLPQRDFRDQMANLLEHVPARKHPRWGRTWRQMENNSPDFRGEAERALHRRFPTPAIWPDVLTEVLINTRPRGYAAEHIPQELPLEWFVSFIETAPPMMKIAARAIRRVAAMQLVQAVNGTTPLQAAHFLGIPSAWLLDRGKRLLPVGRHQYGTPGLDLPKALERLASHIAELPDQTNYHQRRQRFADWHLSIGDWVSLRESSNFTLKFPHERQSDPLIRECVSAVIWAQTTGSEWHLAPIMQPPLSPPGRCRGRSPETRIVTALASQKPKPRFASLAQAPAPFADTIIANPSQVSACA